MIQSQFFQTYNIKQNEFDATGLSWDELLNIKEDYEQFAKELLGPAKYLVERFHQANKVHSVRFRIKKSEHLIAKIIRKKISNPQRVITLKNYKEEITDLIGLRILHLFKDDWKEIHKFIEANWDLHEEATAYYREGDSPEYIESFKDLGCVEKQHPFGYRSIHYLVKTRPCKTDYIAEIQVRTIFEEAWSEIDHKVRYPHHIDDNPLSQFLVILNRLAGSADEMGSYVQFLKKELANINDNHQKQIELQTQKINHLKQQIEQLKLAPQQQESLQTNIDEILKMFGPVEVPTLFNLDTSLWTMDQNNPQMKLPPNFTIPNKNVLENLQKEIISVDSMINKKSSPAKKKKQKKNKLSKSKN